MTDLSSKISAKVDLKKTAADSNDSLSFYASSKMPRRRSNGVFHDGSLSTGDLRELEAIEKRVSGSQ